MEPRWLAAEGFLTWGRADVHILIAQLLAEKTIQYPEIWQTLKDMLGAIGALAMMIGILRNALVPSPFGVCKRRCPSVQGNTGRAESPPLWSILLDEVMAPVLSGSGRGVVITQQPWLLVMGSAGQGCGLTGHPGVITLGIPMTTCWWPPSPNTSKTCVQRLGRSLLPRGAQDFTGGGIDGFPWRAPLQDRTGAVGHRVGVEPKSRPTKLSSPLGL